MVGTFFDPSNVPLESWSSMLASKPMFFTTPENRSALDSIAKLPSNPTCARIRSEAGKVLHLAADVQPVRLDQSLALGVDVFVCTTNRTVGDLAGLGDIFS